MFKTMLLSGALLFNTGLFALDASAAGRCAHIRNPAECSAYFECFWDNDDERCEPRDDGGVGYCGGFFNPSQCDNMPGCFWDNDDERCEPR